MTVFKRKLILVVVLVLIIGAGAFSFLSFNKEQCPIQVEERIVSGGSLSGLIESGSTVKILFGYYNCHEIKREDVVVLRHTGSKNPVIKIVKGLPKDTFGLQEVDFGWNILVNNRVLTNSKDSPYLVTGNRYKMLSLYKKDYGESLPKHTYLILGNVTSGSLDSTRFGLIDKSDILGKVEY